MTTDTKTDMTPDVTSDMTAAEGGEDVVKASRGVQSIVAALTAIASLVVVLRPHSAVAQTLSRVLPVAGDALPAIVTAGATVVAAFSRPPGMRR